MTRPEITAELSAMLEKKINPNNDPRIYWAKEVDINRQIKPNIEYVFEGGRGGLKSSFVAFKIVELIKNNPQMHACITRQVAGTLKDSVYANMKWAINELGLMEEFECKVSPLEIKYIKTGQTIYFRGLDDLEKQIPRKPIDKTKPDDTASLAYENCNIIVCPTCGGRLKLKSKGKYCDKCGQKLDWREEEKINGKETTVYDENCRQ